MARTSERGRDTRTGQFVSIEEANRRPTTTIIQKIKVGPVKKRN